MHQKRGKKRGKKLQKENRAKEISGKSAKARINLPKERICLSTHIPGLDALFEHGIPEGSSVLVAGGTGSGKTILCSQILIHAAAVLIFD